MRPGSELGNKPAYATPPSEMSNLADHQFFYSDKGLTKREYFAGLAMQGLCANSIPGSQHMPETLALEALEYADALL